MTDVKTEFPPTAKNMQLFDQKWVELEEAIDVLRSQQHKLSAYAAKSTNANEQQNAYALMANFTAGIKALTLQQQEVEMWLIENEAPGWTST